MVIVPSSFHLYKGTI